MSSDTMTTLLADPHQSFTDLANIVSSMTERRESGWTNERLRRAKDAAKISGRKALESHAGSHSEKHDLSSLASGDSGYLNQFRDLSLNTQAGDAHSVNDVDDLTAAEKTEEVQDASLQSSSTIKKGKRKLAEKARRQADLEEERLLDYWQYMRVAALFKGWAEPTEEETEHMKKCGPSCRFTIVGNMLKEDRWQSVAKSLAGTSYTQEDERAWEAGEVNLQTGTVKSLYDFQTEILQCQSREAWRALIKGLRTRLDQKDSGESSLSYQALFQSAVVKNVDYLRLAISVNQSLEKITNATTSSDQEKMLETVPPLLKTFTRKFLFGKLEEVQTVYEALAAVDPRDKARLKEQLTAIGRAMSTSEEFQQVDRLVKEMVPKESVRKDIYRGSYRKHFGQY